MRGSHAAAHSPLGAVPGHHNIPRAISAARQLFHSAVPKLLYMLRIGADLSHE